MFRLLKGAAPGRKQVSFYSSELNSIRNSKLTDTLLYDVMGGMEKLVNVTVLDFPNNILTDECVDVLTKAMANKSIKTLNLCNNRSAHPPQERSRLR